MRANRIVLEAFGVFQGNAIVSETVEIPFAEHDNAHLEAAQRNHVNLTGNLAQVVAPVRLEWLLLVWIIIILLPTEFRNALIPLQIKRK